MVKRLCINIHAHLQCFFYFNPIFPFVSRHSGFHYSDREVPFRLITMPSLATNFLYVYQMTHISSPKQVVFGFESVEISDISTGKIIANGVANHASKAYEFSQFLPYSDPIQSQLLGKVKPFYINLLHMIMFPLVFQIQNLKQRTQLNQFMKLNMNFIVIQIQIQSLFPILGLNGHKRLLRKLGT